MNKLKLFSGAAVLVCALALLAAREAQDAKTINLPTGRSVLAPAPGFLARTNSYPATIALSPDGKYAALLNEGYGTQESKVRQSIGILDLSTNQLRDFPDDRLLGDDKATARSYFIGLAFSSDGKSLYASMSAAKENGIAVYSFTNGEVAPARFITIPGQQLSAGKIVTLENVGLPAGQAPSYPAGLRVLPSPGGDRLLIADNLSDNAILLDVTSGKTVASFDLSSSRFVPAAYPLQVIANKTGSKAWVSLWNGSAVAELDLARGKVTRRIELWRPVDAVAPGSHPTAMLLDRSEQTLYVAIANAASVAADGVAAVDLKSGKLTHLYRVALDKNDGPGASTIALALAPDERQLFAASASLNAVAVFAVEPRRAAAKIDTELPAGFIPTEWYPSALAIADNDLLIASAKGESSGPNSMGTSVITKRHPRPHPYIATLIAGAVQRLSLAQIAAELPRYTKMVEENNSAHAPAEKSAFAGGSNPIRHVIYVLKENRTYDQIFGDLGVGDGDPSLVLYGAEVTPNEHKLALQFGVLDNFYDSGDVSANGHLWSDGSATSDYIEKIWPIIYRDAKRPEDQGNPLEQEMPAPDDPGTGYLWDNLARNHRSYRIYGEMMQAEWCKDAAADSPREGSGRPNGMTSCASTEIRHGEAMDPSLSYPNGGPSPWPWAIPRLKEIKPTKAAQRGHMDPGYADFNLEYPDQLRADEFLREFSDFVKGRGSAAALPEFVQVWLPNDHTGGTRAGKVAPRASVADNDLALGRIVEAVSHSPYWDDTAIFVVEDDAQDGADHVDAHRSTALVISKYSPRAEKAFVDHRFYTTVSMVRTMEELLGLPPMNIFDAHAPIMAPLFTGGGDQPAYEADFRNRRNGMLYETNPASAPGAKQSSLMDFTRPDAVNAQELNAILWEDAKKTSGAGQR